MLGPLAPGTTPGAVRQTACLIAIHARRGVGFRPASRFTTMGSVRQVTKDTVLYLPGKAVAGLAGLIAYPLLTRFFTDDDIGRYELTMRFVQFLFTFSVMWLNMVILRFYPTYDTPEKRDTYRSVVSSVRGAGLAVGLMVLFLTRVFGPDSLFGSYRDLLDVAALVFVGFSLFETGQTMLRAQGRPIIFSAALAANVTLKLALGFLIALGLGVGIKGMLWGAGLVPIFSYGLVMHRHFGRIRVRLTAAQRQFLAELVPFGAPVCMTALLVFFLGSSDRYLLRYLTRDDGLVGVFSVGNIVAEQPMTLLASVMMLAVLPAASRVYDTEGRSATEALLGAVTRLYFLVALPAAMLLSVLARPFFMAVISNEPRQAFVVVPWIAFATMMFGLSQYASIGLLMAKRTHPLFIGTALAVAVNIGCNWMLIPVYGYLGCGMARLIANSLLIAVFALASARHLHWRFPFKSLGRIALASAALGFGLYKLTAYIPRDGHPAAVLLILAALSCAGLLLYTIVLLVLGEISRDEMAQLRRYLAKLLGRSD